MVLMWSLFFANFLIIWSQFLKKKTHTAYYVFQIGNYQASKQSFGSFLSKKLGSVNFCYKFLKSSKNFGPYFLKVQYQWSLISQIFSTGPYMGGPYITILRVLGNRANFFRNFNFAKRKRFTRNEMLMMRTGSLCTDCNMVFCLENRGKMVLQNGLTASPSWQQITAPLSFEKQRSTFGHQRSTYL